MMNRFSDIRDIATMSGGDFENICRSNTSYAFLGDNTGLCKVLENFKLFVDTRDIGIVPHLIMDGFWETWLSQSMAKYIEPGSVCIDAGANFGYFTLLMSALSGKEGRTIAIEPNPAIARLLGFSKHLHGFPFEIQEIALSNSNGKITLSIPDNNYGSASTINQPGYQHLKMQKLKVRTRTLDQLVEELELPKVDVIKMDVEGAENFVFEGMQQTIQKNPGLKIFMEYSPHLYINARAFTEYLFVNFNINRIKDVPEPILLGPEHMEELIGLKDHTDLFLTIK